MRLMHPATGMQHSFQLLMKNTAGHYSLQYCAMAGKLLHPEAMFVTQKCAKIVWRPGSA